MRRRSFVVRRAWALRTLHNNPRGTRPYAREGLRVAHRGDLHSNDRTGTSRAEGSDDSQNPIRAELAKERDFIAAVLQASDALVIVLDPEGRIVRSNRACEQVTGYSDAELK